MAKLLVTFGLVAALTACATSQPAPSTASNAPAAPSMATATPAPAAQSGAAAVAKPKLICQETDQMGSHFQQRVCMTPEQAEARKRAAQAAMQNYQNSSICAQGGGGGSCGGPPR